MKTVNLDKTDLIATAFELAVRDLLIANNEYGPESFEDMVVGYIHEACRNVLTHAPDHSDLYSLTDKMMFSIVNDKNTIQNN